MMTIQLPRVCYGFFFSSRLVRRPVRTKGKKQMEKEGAEIVSSACKFLSSEGMNGLYKSLNLDEIRFLVERESDFGALIERPHWSVGKIDFSNADD